MSNNNIEEDIKIAENLINVLNTGDCKFNERLNLGHCGYQEAIANIVNELKRIRSLDINRLVEDYETGQLIDANKSRSNLQRN